MTQLTSRARRYAMIINLLYHRQNLKYRPLPVTRGARHLSYSIRLANPLELDKALKLAEPIAKGCAVSGVLAQRIEGVVNYQVELPQTFWESYTRADVTGLGVGLAEQRQIVEFEFNPPHALVAGTSLCGKTETLRSIIMALIMSYSVNELNLILIDPHRELEEFDNEAHLALPIAKEPEEIKNALAWANQKLAYRKAENIKDDKLIAIIVDEATADEVLSDEKNTAIFKAIAGQARKYRIHLVLGTQKPSHSDLPGIMDNLLNRFCGLVESAKISYLVTGHAGLEAHKLTMGGDFLHVVGEHAVRFQVAQTTQADYRRLARREITPIRVEHPDVIELPPEPPERKPGRPTLGLDWSLLAYYFLHGPDKISRSQAADMGVSRTAHELHRDFAAEHLTCDNIRKFVETLLDLRCGKRG